MKALSVFGWLTAAFGGYACLMVLTHLSEQPSDAAGVRFVASAALAAVGVVIARRARAPRINPREAEQHILGVAQAHDGRITAAEVAAETPVPLAQAAEMLEALNRRSLCRMSIAEAGILVFEFPEFQKDAPKPDQKDKQKAAARAQRTTS
jgi:hypothetical protein